MRALLAVIAVGACTFPDKVLEQSTPYGCLGQPLPTTAPARVTIAGIVEDRYQGVPIPNAALQAFLTGSTVPVFTVQTDATGKFSMGQGTGGTPVDAYLHATANGFLESYLYPAVPVAESSTMLDVQTFTATELGTLAMLAGETLDPTKAQILVIVVDCNDMPVEGAVVATQPAGDVKYLVSSRPSPTAIATDASGAAFVFNVPPSATTINATVSGMMLRSHVLEGLAGALTQTEIQP
jgi:hypothetical protein